MMWEPVFARLDGALIRIKPEELVVLETDKNYVYFHLINKKTPYMIRSSLIKALDKLPEELFVRIHKRTAVSILYIDKIERDHVVMGNSTFSIGREYRERFLKRLSVIDE